ncbi:MAG TPA: hypothetical protein VGW78_02190 [Candidatus Babeliales bacterium]|jgi:hypothetical protein|nr:hypothetical protein [Candidatus Babeliales bacterium]
MDNHVQNKQILLIITSLLCSSIVLIHLYQKPKQITSTSPITQVKTMPQAKKI